MNSRIITELSEISDAYDALFCDLWGCYHNGIEPYKAAVEACIAFRRKGGHVILLTNAPRPSQYVQEFLDKIGAPRESYDAITSSGGACQAAIEAGEFGQGIHYIGPARDVQMLTDIGLEPSPVADADAVLITGFCDDRYQHPDDYAPEIAEWKRRGLPLLCANPDIIVDRGDERLWCAGAVAERYKQAGGKVVYFGKPHAPIYERCFTMLKEIAGAPVPHERILVAGDGIATDVAGGRVAGLDTLFVTGGLAATDLGPDPENPDPAKLARFLSDHGEAPRYTIGRLR